jgi:hypothetical protein
MTSQLWGEMKHSRHRRIYQFKHTKQNVAQLEGVLSMQSLTQATRGQQMSWLLEKNIQMKIFFKNV